MQLSLPNPHSLERFALHTASLVAISRPEQSTSLRGLEGITSDVEAQQKRPIERLVSIWASVGIAALLPSRFLLTNAR